MINFIRKIDPSDSTRSMNGHVHRLLVCRAITRHQEFSQVKPNFIPPMLEFQWHGANGRVNTSRRLVCRRSKSPGL